MNGDEKEEAHRPRPLSAGIWTLFSWLRRNERSSSTESVSSVGSARTAVSFDFLAPGNYNFKNTPIVLTTPLNPPTETYKRRLQDRNLRRQHDRDVTLHRKYGLFREYGNGYDGLTLPLRKTLGNIADRPSRERRATSECLQRRAAYVPGKRRAPLPPALLTSASLPRAYKRKRPAPKPPIKSTYKDNNIEVTNNTVRMTSNSETECKLTPDNEMLNNNKSQKCDKKKSTLKDTKSRTDKSFLKHIFENRKRSSVVETTSLRLLPSISELDKQATEIIESNKLRQKSHNVNPNDSNNSQDTAAYEGNSWFCTSCLRKYNSSVDSCNNCLPDQRHSLEINTSSPRSSMYTQANISVDAATSSRSSMDERKMLKDILKEMKDSLPKKNKNSKPSNYLTEIPTLRIGSTVQETYKDFVSQPSSSRDILLNKNKIQSISSLPERQTNCDQKNITDTRVFTGAKTSNLVNVKQNNATTSEKKSSVQEAFLIDKHKENNSNSKHLFIALPSSASSQQINITKATQDLDKADLKDSINIKNASQAQNKMQLLSIKTNDNIKTSKNNSQISHKTSNNILLDHRQNCLKDLIVHENISNGPNQDSSKSTAIDISVASDKVLPKPSMPQCSNFPNSRSVIVNNVTVVTTCTNNESPETSKKTSIQNIENNSIRTSTARGQNETNITDIQLKSLHQTTNSNRVNNVKTTNNQTKIETRENVVTSKISIDKFKRDYNLHTPLNISSLLNPSSNPNRSDSNESVSVEAHASKHFQSGRPSNCSATNALDKHKNDSKENKEILEIKPQVIVNSSKVKITSTDFPAPQIKETSKAEPHTENVTLTTEVLHKKKVLPSTSGCFSNVTNTKTNLDELDHYDRRRHLINQLEQSIAKGDEVAAAEAATKLAKLRLSCSVLSFSSQIIGATSSSKPNETNKQRNVLEINTTPSIAKPLQPNIPQASTDHVTINTQIKTNEPVNKIENNKLFNKVQTEEHVNITTQTQETGFDNKLQNNKVSEKAETIVNVNIKDQIKASEPNNVLREDKKAPEKRTISLDNASDVNSQSTSGPSSSVQHVSTEIVPINVWIEDKQAARGPIRLNISRQATVADLRRQAEHSLGLDSQLQRWIVGRTLCSDDSSPIASLAGPLLRAPFYLCIVQPDQNDKPATNEVINDNKTSATQQNGEFYTELMKLEKQSLVPNVEPFECGVCMEECAAGAGVILRECIHSFCRECLADVVQHSQEPAVACPATGCSGYLQEREIRTIVTTEEYERWLARGLATAECGTRNAFHCRTRDCTGWAFCDPGVRRFPCPVCKNTNCVQCQAIHEGETCEEYQIKLRKAVTAAETNKDDEGTQALINSLMSRGEALECPECRAIITKKWGCDWVKCSACKTEICWVTKGRRWGPGGRGDTTGGCRCGVNGQRCHPSCGYCH